MLNEVGDYSTVLVTEDDEMLQQMIQIVLQRKGYNTLMAADAEEALSIARSYQGEIDLLLTDMRMPGMPGSVLGSEFKKEHPDSKVVYMTAYSASDVEQSLSGETVIYKPFCLDHFSEVISDSLAGFKKEWQSSC